MIADILGYLQAGINVVTISAIPRCIPKPPRRIGASRSSARLDRVARRSTRPVASLGSVSLNIPTALLTGAGVIDSYRMDEGLLPAPLAGPAIVARRIRYRDAIH